MALNPVIRDWNDQVVWIVGASSGIGRATASRLHALGAVVVVSARNADALNAFVAQHPGSHAVALDVTDPAALSSAMATVLALRGRLDLVVYCAGHYLAMRADSFDLAEMQRHLAVNYSGALHLLDAALPVLIRQGHGHLSLVASVAGYRGLPNAMAYGPTKAALQHLAETLYLDLHPAGIGVSVINPGFVATPLTAPNTFTMPALLTPEQAAQHMVRGWARGRFDIHFPKRFTLWLQLMRLLPHSWYFPAVRRTTQT
ncbi:SDR family NAD(P)-dependent oxidoreductase [Hydrogenophaga sp.]|uniref:SDR family NAD(P)-dependent oxidoreductase n=1 Tax=Hydrogenophaga sp. TaxID=1904254 RepID=UPI003563D226